MIEKWHDPVQFTALIVLYIICHVGYHFWRRHNVRKTYVSYDTTEKEYPSPKPKYQNRWLWVLIGALLYQFFTADEEWIRARSRGGARETQQEDKL